MANLTLKDDLATSGWCLSAEGISKCQDVCKEKGWTITIKNIMKVALNSDLRSIGARSLPTDIARSMDSRVTGPKILQIQKVKNVAVSSTKQQNPSLSKRLIRLQLTDGKVNISAIEIEGAIDKLSPATPPGTKIKLQGTISVTNGFLILTKSCTETLGGQVETLLNKWSLNKVIPDNMDRSKTGTTSGPPPFVALRELFQTSSSTKTSKVTATATKDNKLSQLAKEQDKGSKSRTSKDQSGTEQDKPVRIQLEKPAERPQRKPERKPEATPANRTSSGPPSRYLNDPKRGDFNEHNTNSRLPRDSRMIENQPAAGADDQSLGSRGRRQGGRQRGDPRGDDNDDYQPQSKPKSGYQLADFFGQKLDLGKKKTALGMYGDQYPQAESVRVESFKRDEQQIRNQGREDGSSKRYHTNYDTQARFGFKTDTHYSRGGQRSNENRHDYESNPNSFRARGGESREGYGKGGEQRQSRRDEGYREYTARDQSQKGHGHVDREYDPTLQKHQLGQRGKDGKKSYAGKGTEDSVSSTAHTKVKVDHRQLSDKNPRQNREPQSGRNVDSYRKKNDKPPRVRDAWTDEVKVHTRSVGAREQSEDNHWDWIGSSSSAVPFSARRQ